ncbi:transducin beta-like protein 3 [Ditylenchus destructor]|uniref:Transducin beta-like protein 3 n=1 Tax=Ditylenchus destructor TaxID=166010 RepID=A0AAD4NFG9_9BILA|nr:transducin beta-like protein 3 [Ditylenchus destructor]
MVQGECVELRKSREFKVFYTGGDYALNSTGDILFTTCTNLVKVLSVSDGSERYSIGDPEQESRVTSFVLSDDDSEIIIAYSNDVIKRYSLTNDSCTLLRQFRGTHNAPIMVMKRLRRDSLADTVILATGSSDYSVKIWDLKILDIPGCPFLATFFPTHGSGRFWYQSTAKLKGKLPVEPGIARTLPALGAAEGRDGRTTQP